MSTCVFTKCSQACLWAHWNTSLKLRKKKKKIGKKSFQSVLAGTFAYAASLKYLFYKYFLYQWIFSIFYFQLMCCVFANLPLHAVAIFALLVFQPDWHWLDFSQQTEDVNQLMLTTDWGLFFQFHSKSCGAAMTTNCAGKCAAVLKLNTVWCVCHGIT